MLGAIYDYITHADLMDFQPMKANFGVLPPVDISRRMDKSERSLSFAERAQIRLEIFLAETSPSL
jgi:methylenetetrahydrofolate--tRNA-(uracil-5-)-methyltransferase